VNGRAGQVKSVEILDMRNEDFEKLLLVVVGKDCHDLQGTTDC
jgi:hypothetical protein